jgi:DNA-binding MarR family transcriptional regulator
MGKNLRLLARDGLVFVSVSEADRRSRNIGLTRKGRRLLDGAYPLWKHAHDSLQNAHSKAFLDELRVMLKQISPAPYA